MKTSSSKVSTEDLQIICTSTPDKLSKSEIEDIVEILPKKTKIYAASKTGN